MKSKLLAPILITAHISHATTSEATAALCERIVKVTIPEKTPVADCYNQAKDKLSSYKEKTKAIFSSGKKTPGSLERYLEIVKTDTATNKQCVDFLRTLSKEVKRAGLQDDELFLELSEASGESRATLDEIMYFYDECKSLIPESPTAATPASKPASVPPPK